MSARDGLAAEAAADLPHGLTQPLFVLDQGQAQIPLAQLAEAAGPG